MAYVGNQPARGQFRKLTDISSSFNGVTTTFTTSVPPGTSEFYVTAGSASQLLVSLGGVIQQPDTDYTVSTNSITFTTAPAAGLSFFGVLMGDALNSATPSDGSITAAKLAGNLTLGLAAGSASAPSLFFTGDTNTGIYSPGADQVALTTAGTARLYVSSAGLVGIGTTSPPSLCSIAGPGVTGTVGRLLQVYASSASGAGSGSEIWLGWNPSSTSAGGGVTIGGVYNGSGTDVVFSTPVNLSSSPTERARIDSSGRLLVGTSTALSTNTGALLQLYGTGGSEFIGSSANNNPTAGDPITMIRGMSQSGSSYGTCATIAIQADAATGTNDFPGRIVFSTTADGASSPTERMRISQAGTLTCVGVYSATGSDSPNVVVNSSGTIFRSTSSAKYKTDIETVESSYSDALLNCRPVWYRSTCESDNPNYSYWGFIAEEVAEIDPRLVSWRTTSIDYDENGSVIETDLEHPEPEGVAYDRFVPHLLNLIKRQKEQIEAMEVRLSALEGA